MNNAEMGEAYPPKPDRTVKTIKQNIKDEALRILREYYSIGNLEKSLQIEDMKLRLPYIFDSARRITKGQKPLSYFGWIREEGERDKLRFQKDVNEDWCLNPPDLANSRRRTRALVHGLKRLDSFNR